MTAPPDPRTPTPAAPPAAPALTRRLIDVRTPDSPSGVVVVMHGGAAREGRAVVSPTQLSVLRMIPVARRIARAGGGRLAVVRLLNSFRGWDRDDTPVADAEWALARLRERFGDLPVALVGHSLGGRTALMTGDRPRVRSLVLLNPWLYPTDRIDLDGRQVLFVHGSDDRIASPDASRQVAEALGATADVTYQTIPGGKHAMLRHGAAFERAAADFAVATLLP